MLSRPSSRSQPRLACQRRPGLRDRKQDQTAPRQRPRDVQAGHRELVLLLASVYQRPVVDAGNKKGMWSTSRSTVAYYSPQPLFVTGLQGNARRKEEPLPHGIEQGPSALPGTSPTRIFVSAQVRRTQVRLRLLPVPNLVGREGLAWVLSAGSACSSRTHSRRLLR